MRQQKILFLLMAVMAIAVFGVSRYGSVSPSENDYSLLIQNVEALTDPEDNGTKQFVYPNGYPYDGTCKVAIGKGFFGTRRCDNPLISCQGGGVGCNPVDCPIHPRNL